MVQHDRSGEGAIDRTGQARGARRPGPPGPATLRAMTDIEDVLAAIDTWGADHAAAARRRAGRGPRGPRRRRPSLPLGVGDQARDRVDRADRRRTAACSTSTSLPVRRGRPSAICSPTPLVSRSKARRSSPRPGRGGSTRTPGSMRSARWSGSGPAGRSRPSSATGSSAPLGMDRHAPGGAALARFARADRRPRRARVRALPPDACRTGDRPCGDDRRVRRARRRRAGRRAIRSLRLGAWARVARRQDSALDGGAKQPRDVRTLRRVRDVRLDRSGRRARVGGADGPRIRRLGSRGVAAVLRCGARRRRRRRASLSAWRSVRASGVSGRASSTRTWSRRMAR